MSDESQLISRTYDGEVTVLTVGSRSATDRHARRLIAHRRDFEVRSLPGDVWKVTVVGEWGDAGRGRDARPESRPSDG